MADAVAAATAARNDAAQDAQKQRSGNSRGGSGGGKRVCSAYQRRARRDWLHREGWWTGLASPLAFMLPCKAFRHASPRFGALGGGQWGDVRAAADVARMLEFHHVEGAAALGHVQ
ncbi:MAG: hypothetical protein RL385_4595 [Pseudomonadota bacterium]